MTENLAQPQTRESQARITPTRALEILREGNRRFVDGTPLDRSWAGQVEATASSQYPFAFVLGCIDSRVPVETVFDQGIGDVITARVAGNVINDDLLGSMELACKIIGCKAILVLGHTSCGAVQAAIDSTRLGNVTGLLQKIEPVVEEVRRASDHIDPRFTDRVAEAHVHRVLEASRQDSTVLAAMEQAGDVVLAGAMYDVATGVVRFL